MKKTIEVAAAVITNSDGKILCALRSPTMSLPNLWEFPGGKIEPGESGEVCLVREIAEELGCQIEVANLLEDTTHDYGNFIIRLMTFDAKIIEGVPSASEHAALLWLPIASLKSLHWAPADIPAVDKLVGR